MCFDHDALPPDLPPELPHLAGGAAAEILEASAADGTTLSVALAPSGAATDPAVVIIPDVRGLYRFYIELAERFAAAGHHAVAIDPFGRTAGTGVREGDWDYWPHVRATTPQSVQADVAAAIAVLHARTDAARVVVVGFCYGGAHAFLAATNADLPIDGVVGFYGALSGERLAMPSAKDAIATAVHPVLALFGGADEGIPEEQREVFGANLERSSVPHEIVVYPGAPHSFFDRRQEEYADDSADAWRRVLRFLGGA
ncbi:MAG TPA: dienelactone hydrolase family protein [Solirubrobacteraceae bacterium]